MKLRIEIPVILHTLGKFYSDPIPEKTWRKKKRNQYYPKGKYYGLVLILFSMILEHCEMQNAVFIKLLLGFWPLW